MSAVGTILLQSQGVMRAQPEMQPWVHTDKSKMSPDKERHLQLTFALCRFGSLGKCRSYGAQCPDNK